MKLASHAMHICKYPFKKKISTTLIVSFNFNLAKVVKIFIALKTVISGHLSDMVSFPYSTSGHFKQVRL